MADRAALDEGSPLKKKLFQLAVEIGYARFEHAQGRGPWKPSFLLWPILNALVAKKILARLGGRMRAALSGGAALPPDISRVFTGLGLCVLQGYGLTETSPVACANRPDDNLPASIGKTVPGVQVKIGEHNALMIKGPNVMLGYSNNPEATKAMIQPDGWLNSGDTARIDGQGHIFITGRLKEIIVLSNGEKVPPVDIESAIARDALFEQVMLLGEGKPYLSVMTVLNGDQWKKVCAERGLDAAPATISSNRLGRSCCRASPPGRRNSRATHRSGARANARALDGGERPAHTDHEAEARQGDGKIQRRNRRHVRGPLKARMKDEG